MPEGGAGGDLDEAEAYRVSDPELWTWRPLSPFEVHLARRAGASQEALVWVALGASVTEATRAQRHGVTPEAVQLWLDAGFAATDAIDAAVADLPLDVAVAWRDAGFVLPEALLLLRDGWTLPAATARRYVDVARNNA